MRDSETCCVQRGGVVSFQPDMGEQIRAPLRSIASARECVPAPAVRVVYAHVRALTVHQLFPERPAVFPGTNYGGTCPFPPSVLEVMWLALQGRHHRYTHRSAEILPAPAGPSTAVLEK